MKRSNFKVSDVKDVLKEDPSLGAVPDRLAREISAKIEELVMGLALEALEVSRKENREVVEESDLEKVVFSNERYFIFRDAFGLKRERPMK